MAARDVSSETEEGLDGSHLERARSSGPKRTIAVLATLDTKLEEALFVAGVVEREGMRPCVVDLSLRSGHPFAEQRRDPRIINEARSSEKALRRTDKETTMREVANEAATLLARLVGSGDVDGVIGLGGGTGTWLAGMALQELPIGVPKVLVSTIAGRISPEVLGLSDIIVVPSVTDIAGLNSILRRVLSNSTVAVCAMSRNGWSPESGGRSVVAMSMFGVTTTGGTIIRGILEEAGLEVAVFHANGAGGRIMEQLISAGSMTAVVDLTTTEVMDEIAGGRCSAGPDRLTSAGARGIPQVVVPGAMDVINAGPPEDLASTFAGRIQHMHRPNSVLIRSSPWENHYAGALIAHKLNQAKGPVRILIPLEGFSALDTKGGPFEDRKADEAFLVGLREEIRSGIMIEVIQANINDREFAEQCAARLIDMLNEGEDAPTV